VFAFDLFIVFIVFFVFIPDSLHQSRESMKIGPHPRGCPSSRPLARSDQQSSIAKSKNKKKKKASVPRPGRLGAEIIWGLVPASSARPAPLAWARRTSGVQRQIGPNSSRPKFELAKKKQKKK
jgi:hypothetical protein